MCSKEYGEKQSDNLLRTKAGILCQGIKLNQTSLDIYALQHPTNHRRTGNIGLQLKLGKNTDISAVCGEPFSERSPFQLEKFSTGLYLVKNNLTVMACDIIPAPNWYTHKTTDGTTMADILLQEGTDTLITAVWNDCVYFADDNQCGFCTLADDPGRKWKRLIPFLETVDSALSENPDYYLHLTGGNTKRPDHGLLTYEKYVKEVKKRYPSTPVSLETSPPENMEFLERLIDAGTDGFSINIEVWNEEKRKQICPGKSQIARDSYFEAWQKGVEALGAFRISSVIVVGLDTKESIKEAIATMVNMGVKPALVPFKPFAKSILNDLSPPNPDDFLELSLFSQELLEKHGADPTKFVGCEHCMACTM